MPTPLDTTPLALKAAPDPFDDEDLYPSSDGEPMADNMWQAEAIMNAAGDIRSARPQALVAADILLYPQQGNPANRIAPDVLVAFGLGTHKRPSYFVWREGKPPDWVLEVASPRTAARDLDEKRHSYARIGVPEYWLFDPRGDLFRQRGEPQLQGLKLIDGIYQPLDTTQEQGLAMIRSEVLGLDLRVDGELLRFREPATGQDIRHRDETEALVAELQAALRRAGAGSQAGR